MCVVLVLSEQPEEKNPRNHAGLDYSVLHSCNWGGNGVVIRWSRLLPTKLTWPEIHYSSLNLVIHGSSRPIQSPL
jgi:hypothetical protein